MQTAHSQIRQDAFNKPFCFCSSLCTQWLNKSIVNLLKIKDWVTLFQSWYSSLCTWLKHLRQKCQPQVFQKKKKTFCDTISWIFELTRAELGVSVHSNFYCRSPRRCFYWVGSTFLLGHSRTFTELSWSYSCVFLAAHWNRNLCHSLKPGACLKRFSLNPYAGNDATVFECKGDIIVVMLSPWFPQKASPVLLIKLHQGIAVRAKKQRIWMLM